MRAVRTTLEQIQPLRRLFLQEANHQVRYDAVHARGWSDSYLLTCDETVAGYGAIMGEARTDRNTVFELYVTPSSARQVRPLFDALVAVSGATRIECQSNDSRLSGLLFECARNIRSDTILFEPDSPTSLTLASGTVRRRQDEDRIFEHGVEPVGDYVLDLNGEVVATGGYLLHYNVPFADLYMEVHPNHRRKGSGSFLVQEIIKACYRDGHVPAARCRLENAASRATLTKAGLRVCGYMLTGEIASASIRT